jgi:TonB family protein
VHITPEGRVDQVRLDSASSHAGFNRAAVRIAERLRYRPARWNDAPTDVWWMEAIDFRLP